MMDADHQHRPGPSGYDAELRRHNEVQGRACGIQVRDHVLDIGCGTVRDDDVWFNSRAWILTARRH